MLANKERDLFPKWSGFLSNCVFCYETVLNCFYLKVWDREKLVIIPDHYIFTTDERANRNVDILRDFCTEQNIKYFYDIKDLGNFKVRLTYSSHYVLFVSYILFSVY